MKVMNIHRRKADANNSIKANKVDPVFLPNMIYHLVLFQR